MTTAQLTERDCWRIARLNNAAKFFRAASQLLAGATHVYLEESPAPEIVALISRHADPTPYRAPAGTFWSWPRGSQRFALKASPAMLAELADASTRHAEPEICSHLHFYRDAEPLAQWFDAFDDPLLVSKTIPRELVEHFCREAGGELCDG
jgi:hypothetical protein